MELQEVLSEIKTLKAECEMLLRITAAVDDLEKEVLAEEVGVPASLDVSFCLH
ncbi:MAG TPA: hypothetical protein VGL56_08425 [Fimbriimonadaceae bacterium]